MPQSHVTISMTEIPHFARLVRFLTDVDDYAHREVDLELKDLVEDCRAELLERHGDADV